MSEQLPEISRHEWFDNLLERFRLICNEELMGSYSRQIELGGVALRALVFDPRAGQNDGYGPIIQIQDLAVAQAHEGLYWAPFSGTILRRSELDMYGADKKLARIEMELDIFKKFLDFNSEISG